MYSKTKIKSYFTRAASTYSQEANVQAQIAGKMSRLLRHYIPTLCPEVIEIGCGTGIYSRLLFHILRPEHLLLNDLCPEMEHCCTDLLTSPQVAFLSGDAETLHFPGSPSLITSCSTLQWFESPEVFFRKCNVLLRRQGYFAFSTFGQKNMQEIRQLTGRGLPYRPLQELIAALQPDFRILHSEEEYISLTFDHPLQVLYHLKRTGVTGLPTSPSTDKIPFPAERIWTRRDVQHFCDRYRQMFGRSTSTCVALTYHPIYIIAQKE